MWCSGAEKELYDIFTDLLRIDSTNPPGNEIEVCEYIASLLKRDAIESSILSEVDGRANLYAKIGGGNGQPIILLSHVDVAPANGDEWKYGPFDAINDDGVIYGRGALDTKQLTAMQLMAMILIKREGIPLSCPIILIASADEENESTYGMEYLSTNQKHLLPDGAVISEGGGFVLSQDGKFFRTCTCGEKGHCNMTITISTKDESALSDSEGSVAGLFLEVLERLGGYDAAEELCRPAVRFMKVAPPPHSDTTLRNLWQYSTKSCLAIDAFDIIFENEQEVELKLTYQFLPGTSQAEIERLIAELLAGLQVSFRVDKYSDGYESDMENPLYRQLESVSLRLDPDVKLLPILALGRTDGRFIRNNVFGYSPLLGDIPFSQVLKKVHRSDECITEASLFFGGQVIYETIRELASNS